MLTLFSFFLSPYKWRPSAWIELLGLQALGSIHRRQKWACLSTFVKEEQGTPDPWLLVKISPTRNSFVRSTWKWNWSKWPAVDLSVCWPDWFVVPNPKSHESNGTVTSTANCSHLGSMKITFRGKKNYVNNLRIEQLKETGQWKLTSNWSLNETSELQGEDVLVGDKSARKEMVRPLCSPLLEGNMSRPWVPETPDVPHLPQLVKNFFPATHGAHF